MEMGYKPILWIMEAIEVAFDQPPLLEKKPGCPVRFTWRETTYQVVEVLNEWQDFTRRGRMSRNMRPAHAAAAATRGSWGVGQFTFRVRTDTGQVFDICYDRAPRDAGDRKGGWFIDRELEADGEADQSSGPGGKG
jgi:hypothetical protein